MPTQDDYKLPQSVQELPVPSDQARSLYVCFIASVDPATNQPWCSDVRASLPRLKKTFSDETSPKLLYVNVGQKPEWKELDNIFRKQWGISAIPTLVRYQRVNGEVKEIGRLVEADIVNDEKYNSFVKE